MISTNSRTSTEWDESSAIEAYFRGLPTSAPLPCIDHLSTERGRTRVEQAMASKVAELVAGHDAATEDTLRCFFSCREIQECFSGAVRRLPTSIREMALAA